MEECLAKNLIKELIFQIFFWFKSGDTETWQDYTIGRDLVKSKNFDDIISNSKVWRHNCHFDVATTYEVESLHCFFAFRWIKLKLGITGNFRLLISNLNSKAQYQFAILRKCHFSSLRLWFLAQHSLMNWLPWKQWMSCLQSLNFKRYYR